MPDLIASTANNLKKDGWVAGQTWGYEVVVPQGFNFLLADRSRVMTVQEWERAGIRRAGGKPFPRGEDRAYLLVPAGAQGPGFLMLQNFRVIMKYNPAEAYALAIGYLADRLRGGPAFVQPWPRHERVLTARNATNCSSFWPSAASTWASPTAGSGAGPAARCASSSRRSATCPTGLPRRRCSSGCAAGKEVLNPELEKVTFWP